jgi:hypothetical protein
MGVLIIFENLISTHVGPKWYLRMVGIHWVYQVNWNSDGYGFIGGKKLLATLADLEVIERCLEMPLVTLRQVQCGQNELHALSTPPKITMHSWKFRNQNLNEIYIYVCMYEIEIKIQHQDQRPNNSSCAGPSSPKVFFPTRFGSKSLTPIRLEHRSSAFGKSNLRSIG